MATPLNVAEDKKPEKKEIRNGERLRTRPTRKTITNEGSKGGTEESSNREDTPGVYIDKRDHIIERLTKERGQLRKEYETLK